MKGLLQPLLYLAISGLVAGFGWQIYQLAEFRKGSNSAAREQRKSRNEEELQLLLSEGKQEVDAGTAGDVNYRAGQPWDALKNANFHGYVPPPPPPVDTEGPTVVEPVETPKTPLEEIFAIEALYYDVRGSGDEVKDLSRISIRYKASANIQPPAGFDAGGEAFRPGDTAGDSRRGTNRSAANNTNRTRPRSGAFPAAAASGEYAQILRVGDTLWEPHGNVRLVRVDNTANFAYFVREGAESSEQEPEEERIAREIDGLNVSQDVLTRLIEEGYESSGSTDQGGAQSTAPVIPSGWQDVEQTTIFRDNGENRVNFARNDPVMQDPARFFNERVGTRTYNRGGRRGVQIVSVPAGSAATYGVENGDIVISINGVEVGSQAEAIRVGRRQYDQGRRTFEAVILRNGRQVTQTFVAPEN